MISFRGCLHVALLRDGGDPNTLTYVRDTSGWPAFEFERLDKFRFYAREALWPVWKRQDLDATHDLTFLWLPLWLLAFLCLAWPVTSFLIARRKRKGRGFEVEAKAASSTPLPPGEVAAQRSGADREGSQQHATEQ
jgi:hypothetical protein